MKNKKKINWWGIIKSLLGILVIVVIILLGFRFFKGKQINANSSEVNEIYTYLGQNDLSYCNGLSVYADSTVDYNSVENTNRICNAVASLYSNNESTLIKIDKTKKNNTCSLNENIIFATDNYSDNMCSLYRIDKEKVAEKYEKIYGEELKDYESFNLSNTMVCQPDGEYYYCGLSETFTVTVGAEPETFRSIKEVVEKGNKLIIYDYFIKVINEECYTSYAGSTENNSCTSEYKTDKDINYNYLKKYGTLYKHTFKKGKNGYYWVQSEPN